jgi:CheY-like chemotaxis protein
MIELPEWNVMFIDDEPDNIGVVEFVFGFYKVAMRSATTGAEGLAMMRQQLPTVLLLDIQMPAMSGWEVLQEIRKDSALNNLVVIALTAHAMAGDQEKALAAGFDGYLTKPISPLTFLDDIKAVLKTRNMA